jgi:hypothetical protein
VTLEEAQSGLDTRALEWDAHPERRKGPRVLGGPTLLRRTSRAVTVIVCKGAESLSVPASRPGRRRNPRSRILGSGRTELPIEVMRNEVANACPHLLFFGLTRFLLEKGTCDEGQERYDLP